MIQIDPEFQTWIMPLREDEYRGLEQSILEDGCREPLVLWGDILVDGHNRLRICTEHGIPFKTTQKEFGSREDVKNWMINIQLGRRNVTTEQRNYLVGKLYKEQKTNPVDNLKQNSPSGHNVRSVPAAEKISQMYKVDEKTVRRAETFADAIDTIAEICGDTVKNDILTKNIPVSQKDIVQIAHLDPDKQKQTFILIQRGEKTSQAIRKAVNQQPYEPITRLADLKEPDKPRDPDFTLCSCANPLCDNFIKMTRSQRVKFFTTYVIKYNHLELPYCSKNCQEDHKRALAC